MRSSTRRGSKSPRIVLSPEPLEDRTNPSGNVTVIQEGGVLHVWGDGGNNRVWLAGAGENTVVISPLNGTTLNGTRTQLWYTGIEFAYDVRLHNGNDFVLASGLTGSAGLFIDSGSGNDGVALEHLDLDGVLVNTGAGDDTIHLGGGKFNWAAFNLGVGDDRMNVFGTAFGGSAFVGGAGTDSLAVMSVKWREDPLTTGFETVFSTLLPFARNDSARVNPGATVTINVLANDSAILGILDPSTVTITSQPKHGTATVNDDGTITYESDDNTKARRDTFRYTVRSSTGAISNEATVTLFIPDLTDPVPDITTTATSPTNAATIPFKITFSEKVTGFEETDVTVTNGTISSFAVDPNDPKVFNVVVTPTADGTVTVSVAAGAAQDRSGNESVADSLSIVSDRTAPSVTISSTETSPTNADPIPITVTFSESVSDFQLSDIAVSNGTASNLTGSGANYTFQIDPTANATVTVNIAAGAANDLAGNPSLAATEFTIVSDTGAPSVTLSTSAGTPTNLAAIPFQAVFSESVDDFIATDITVTNGTVVNFQGSGTTYTFDVEPIADGDVTVAINAGVAHDSGGNPNTPATSIVRVSDRTAPTATVETSEPDPTSANPIPFTVTFSEVVTGFTAGDVLVVNGSVDVASFSGSGTTYTFNVVPSGSNVQVSVSVPAGVAEDAATNGNEASNTVTRQFNGTTVSTTITTTANDPTNLSPIPMTVTFGEAVTGFDLADINVTNGTASNLQGSGANYTFDVTPTADGPVVVDVVAGAATGDVSGGPTSAAQLTITSDTTAPGATITGPASPSNASPMQFSIAFTEAVTGFDLADITVTNGTASNVQGSGGNYTFDVTPLADGDVVVNVPATAVTDAAGNDSTASNTVTVVSDTTAPTVLVETTEPDPTSANPIPFTVTFSESVTGFTAGDILVVNGAVTNFAGTGTSFTFDVAPSGNNVEVSVSVPAGVAEDGATNGNLVSNTVTRTFNGTTVSTTLSSPSGSETNDSPFQIAVVFGESVTGFDLSDISVTNGTPSNLQGSGANYTFDVTPTADGPVVIDVVAGAATGEVSGDPTSAAQITVTSDTTAPTASITAPTGPTNDDPLPFSVTFSETVTGLELADIVVENGTASNLQGSGTTYTFDVTPTADGAVNVSIIANAASDAAGNGNAAAGPATVQSDKTNPQVTVNDTAAGAITGTSTDTSGVTGVEISISNGTFFWSGTAFDSATEVFHATTSSDNFATWSLTFAPGGPFTVHARATDVAGNVGESTNSNVTVT